MRHFRVGGLPMSAAPYVPEAYRPYFDENGGGGVEFLLESNPDPTCIAKVDTPQERDLVYSGRGIEPPCIAPGGELRVASERGRTVAILTSGRGQSLGGVARGD